MIMSLKDYSELTFALRSYRFLCESFKGLRCFGLISFLGKQHLLLAQANIPVVQLRGKAGNHSSYPSLVFAP